MKDNNINVEDQQEDGQFFKLYKELYEGELHDLNIHSKVLYSLLIDRYRLSRKNGWVDDHGETYIFYSRENMGKILNCSRKTASKYFKELVDIGLVKEVPQGINKPNIIYVTPMNTWTGKIDTSGGVNITRPEGYNLPTSKTECIKTEVNKSCATEIAPRILNDNLEQKTKDPSTVLGNFESLWNIYPSKKGKAKVTDKKKKEIFELGEEFERCINRYKKYVGKKRAEGFKDLNYQNGSTFFSSGYIDYLDENYDTKETKAQGNRSNISGMNIPEYKLEELRKLKQEQKKREGQADIGFM